MTINEHALRHEAQQLAADIRTKMADRALTTEQKSRFIDGAEKRQAEIEGELKTIAKAKLRRHMADGIPTPPGATATFGPGGQVSYARTKAVGRPIAASPLDAGEDVWRELHDAAIHRKSFRASIGTKAPTSVGGLSPALAPTLSPTALTLPYEPDRLFDHFLGQQMEGPSVEYVQHTGNTNPAAVVAEGATKPDVGLQISTEIVYPTKIAALASITMEAAEDFQTFLGFVPSELTRAVIDAETDEVVNGSGTAPHLRGLVNTPGILTRALGTDTPLDALEQAVNDLRVGPAFADANLFAMNPSTFSFIRRQKNTQNNYLLDADPSAETAKTIWGVPVVVNTKIPVGDVLVLDTTQAVLSWTRHALSIEVNHYGDTEWQNNLISFRAEERIAIGVQRPAAVSLVTGVQPS